MEKFLDKLFRQKLWVHYVLWFFVSFILSLMFIPLIETPNIKGLILIAFPAISAIFAMLPTYMVYMIRINEKFYDEANRIEKMIKAGEQQDITITALYELKKQSWHRITGERLRELAKMAEVKYNIEILKR